MTIKDFKLLFFAELKELYPITEIQSFFNLLIENTLKFNRIESALNPNFEISTSNLSVLKNALTDLTKHIPIQYIIGHTEFYGLQFNVNNNVLIPRPETEELVNWIVQENNTKAPLKIVDIGTGSGCIAITLAKFFPFSEITAVDISAEAIKVAKQNAELNNVKINFIEKDILKTTDLTSTFDIIVSNPPYVRQQEKTAMHKNVLHNEPHLALFVEDNNPLLFYNKIADLAINHLNPNGLLYFEINQYLGNDMVQLLSDKNFKNIALRKDFYNQDRMIKASE